MRLLSIDSSLRWRTRRSTRISLECCESESSTPTLPPSDPASTVTASSCAAEERKASNAKCAAAHRGHRSRQAQSARPLR